MSRYSPHDVFAKTPDLRTRQIPEWGALLVYTPSFPDIHMLDARSWLLFELCDGRTFQEIATEFRESVPEKSDPELVSTAIEHGLHNLEDKMIVTRSAATSAAS